MSTISDNNNTPEQRLEHLLQEKLAIVITNGQFPSPPSIEPLEKNKETIKINMNYEDNIPEVLRIEEFKRDLEKELDTEMNTSLFSDLSSELINDETDNIEEEVKSLSAAGEAIDEGYHNIIANNSNNIYNSSSPVVTPYGREKYKYSSNNLGFTPVSLYRIPGIDTPEYEVNIILKEIHNAIKHNSDKESKDVRTPVSIQWHEGTPASLDNSYDDLSDINIINNRKESSVVDNINNRKVLQGDFCVWSEGEKLTVEGIGNGYVGLVPSVLTHNNVNGVLIVGNRTDNNNDDNDNSATIDNEIDKISIMESDHNHLKDTNIPQNKGYYAVHVMECVVRPDMLLKDFLSAIIKVVRTVNYRYTLTHTSQLLVLPSKRHRQSHGKNSTIEVKEWDLIDIQVCISKELRQRVILCQFLRRIPAIDSSGLGGAIIHQLTGGHTILPLHQCIQTKAFVAKLKKELIANDLCLSALYTVPLTTVCALPQQPQGIDIHFRAQLHRMLWKVMWKRLEKDLMVMTDHAKEQNEACHKFLKTIEPILKLYSIPVPLPWTAAKMRPALTNSTATSDNSDTQCNVFAYQINSERENTSVVETLELDSNSPPSHSDRSKYDSEPFDAKKDYEERQLRRQAKHKLRQQQNHSSSKGSPVTPKSKVFNNESELTPTKRALADRHPQLRSHMNYSKGKYLSREADDSMDDDKVSRYERDLKAQQNTNGMTLCLVMLDTCYKELQEKCDDEHMKRVQLQNRLTVRQIDDMTEYRRGLLTQIAYNPNSNIEEVPLMKNFLSLFKGVILTKDPIKSEPNNNILPTSSIDNATTTHANSDGNDKGRRWVDFISGFMGKNDDNQETVSKAVSKRIDLDHLETGTPYVSSIDQTPSETVVDDNTEEVLNSYEDSNSKMDVTGGFDLEVSDRSTGAANGFRAKELRLKVPADTVKSRLAKYAEDAAKMDPSTAQLVSPTLRTADGTEIKPKRRRSLISDQEDVPFLEHPSMCPVDGVVLYYCACLVHTYPGTLYVTRKAICLVHSTVLVGKVKEVIPLAALTDIIDPTTWMTEKINSSNNKSNMIANTQRLLGKNTLKLLFFDGRKELFISPMVVDCSMVKTVILEIKATFPTSFFW